MLSQHFFSTLNCLFLLNFNLALLLFNKLQMICILKQLILDPKFKSIQILSKGLSLLRSGVFLLSLVLSQSSLSEWLPNPFITVFCLLHSMHIIYYCCKQRPPIERTVRLNITQLCEDQYFMTMMPVTILIWVHSSPLFYHTLFFAKLNPSFWKRTVVLNSKKLE